MNKFNLNQSVDQDGLAVENAVRAGQQKEPPAYLVAEGTVLDPATFHTYAQQVPNTLMPFGGTFWLAVARSKLSKAFRRSSR
jgi:hypothetical protein